jgi:predicted Holliday junction resolvase-like endonuclease
MQNENKNTALEEMSLQELQKKKDELKEKYRLKKSELHFAENIVDESFVREELESIKKSVKLYAGRIEELLAEEIRNLS